MHYLFTELFKSIAFISGLELETVYSIECNQNRPICAFCNRQFHSEQTLKRHILERHAQNPRRFTCDVCMKTFSRRHYVMTHKKMVHSIT